MLSGAIPLCRVSGVGMLTPGKSLTGVILAVIDPQRRISVAILFNSLAAL